ncbi:hypothetical protein HaLaN_25477 [Haematococcus lacustris]|uniref:Uncharacterized protein n=1 Tax=Haematococcus lacustris TaxID=44745 RepID=A0A6A0A3K4_HAELA|nr:hypothetical protein HaLaN_25477 [Haematococcus lacustris]
MPTSSDRGLKRRRDISADEEEEGKEVSSEAAEPRPERVELDSLPELRCTLVHLRTCPQHMKLRG